MAFLGFRRFPTPIIRPMWPFMISGTIVLYLVHKIEKAGQSVPPYDIDPRNPRENTLSIKEILVIFTDFNKLKQHVKVHLCFGIAESVVRLNF
ncbi:4206_t:CDS:2 [Dentiscutata erythropus]|uniref:4206_t:CDS:1 n=1 Tax=Dentiscutata erythropus TaxID=1348616 RepID=A0A9N9C0Y4_9GLOM|nr:4206_t:CDS:2 [Dentiscutata erythropus]